MEWQKVVPTKARDLDAASGLDESLQEALGQVTELSPCTPAASQGCVGALSEK